MRRLPCARALLASLGSLTDAMNRSLMSKRTRGAPHPGKRANRARSTEEHPSSSRSFVVMAPFTSSFDFKISFFLLSLSLSL